ncbi:beta-N-acetylhexosaminidase [Xylanibacillus composti]|uniref:Beta-glucosidase n=1 Tax=Xylanibacillus composti TaxID=1572762 RepID=A0A8J4M3W6_9BACL|nr:beta-N-acetylhexosaminidase [Xylanibacillus composti]MDT9726493.1 beta-N-acetylhexosaminidase [Xylanibacillus composti]GIQ69936.1 beta-glucosidase [Xylanibacillus composti]
MRSLTSMTLEEKVGQLLICGFAGTEPPAGMLRFIRERKPGGIIYFRRNIASAGQLRSLSDQLQQAAKGADAPPLFIAIDQEGGMVARWDQDAALMPGNMAIGATRRASYAYEAANATGRQLREVGINVNFAPCVDVNNNPANPVIGVRSFGADPDMVAEFGAAAVRGYQEAGVSAAAKHFPGHGDTDIDSHLDLPIIPHAMERLHHVELKPFAEAVRAGTDMIMTAHVVFQALEGNEAVPATLSPRVLDGLLRGQLQFQGIIITDCLEMKAISDGVGVAEGAVRAVEAGADIVLVSHTIARQEEALDALLHAVRSGRMSESRIDASVQRILDLKQKRIAAGTASPPDIPKVFEVNAPAFQKLARSICRDSVTLVRHEGVLPLDSAKSVYVVWPEVTASTEVVEAVEQEMTLGQALQEHLPRVAEDRIALEPGDAELARVLERSQQYEQVVVATYHAGAIGRQGELVRRLMAERLGRGVVVVAVRNPYDLLAFPDVPAYLAVYENRPQMMEALAEVLVGKHSPSGRLPVQLMDQYPIGWGLSYGDGLP